MLNNTLNHPGWHTDVNMTNWEVHVQKQHACMALMLFNVPKGDTQLTYFWLAKFFTCQVALA